MAISFGIPKRVVESKERYPETPVVTLEKVEDKGHNRRFVLNKKAIQLLQVIPGVSHIAFAFDGMNAAYISKNSTEDSFLLGKNMAFSNKKYYEHICKIYGLDSSTDSDFELTDEINVGGVLVYRMKHIVSEAVPVVHNNPVVDKEIEHLVEQEHINFQELVEAEEMYINDILDEEADEETGEIIEKVKKEQFLMNAY